MKKNLINNILVLVLIFSAVNLIIAQDFQMTRRNLMPVPANVIWKNGRLPIAKNFTVAISGKTDERLKRYIFRVMRRLEGRTIFEFLRDFSIRFGKCHAFN